MVGHDALDATKMCFQLHGRRHCLSIETLLTHPSKAASGILNRKSMLLPLPLLNLFSFACLPWKAPGDTTLLPSELVTEGCSPVA